MNLEDDIEYEELSDTEEYGCGSECSECQLENNPDDYPSTDEIEEEESPEEILKRREEALSKFKKGSVAHDRLDKLKAKNAEREGFDEFAWYNQLE